MEGGCDVIDIRDATKSFVGKNGNFKAVDNVTLSISDKEIFGIVGESGAGKSTLMRFINALETPDSGAVLVGGINVSTLNKSGLRRHQKDIGMIFQHFNLLNNKTVEENIKLPLELHKYKNPLSVEDVIRFVGLEDKRENYPAELSGGEKQRVGIARALVTRPKILLCDEPTSALDENTTAEIVDVLRKAQDEFDMTVVIVTHELNVIKQLCHRSAVLENGSLIDTIDINHSVKAHSDQSYHARVLEVLQDV